MDGIDILKQKLATLPTSSGVYRMLNEAGDILYVGKAKNLKNRLTSYTQPERLSTRIRKMVFETRELIIVETATEAEALLLEANLIKSLKPKYNIIFRDDANYISVLITQEETPMIRHHRGAKRQKGDYYGPYPSADAVYKTLDILERTFRLRTCKPSIFNHRTRPCLKYDIKRCSAPCVGKISPESYAKSIRQAKLFLDGKSTQIQKELQQDMLKASANLDYEQAADIRDKLQQLVAVSSNNTTLTHAIPSGDVFACIIEGGKACIQVFSYRNGQHIGNKQYFPTIDAEDTPNTVLRHFLPQYYDSRLAPPIILCNEPPQEAEELAEALALRTSHKVTIQTPQRGDKLTIIKQASHNARQNLQRYITESSNWQTQMTTFSELLTLEKPIERIECFDISNISGKQAVASMVVANTEGMDKKAYRKFTINTKDTPDDYTMMHEALTRRYSRLIKEKSALPSVILVDGGVGHLNILVKVMEELNLIDEPTCPALTAIAKGEERNKGLEKIFLHQNNETIQLEVPFNTPLIFMLQKVRDEAHRFGITFHRQKRSKGITSSGLDAIPNIGGKRKKALLLHFGSLTGVKNAPISELSKVEGSSKTLAEEIYQFFR